MINSSNVHISLSVPQIVLRISDKRMNLLEPLLIKKGLKLKYDKRYFSIISLMATEAATAPNTAGK